MTAQATLDATTAARQADELLAEAHAAAYRFPADFSGFVATVAVTGEGWVAQGSVTVGGPSAVDLALDAPEDERVWSAKELASLVAHRWHQPYDTGDGRHQKEGGPDEAHPLGRLVRLVGGPHSSSYRVLDGHVSQVERHMGPMRFSVVVHERAPAPDRRAVPSTFTVSYWNTASGALARTDAYLDAYTEVGGVLLPRRRRVVTATDDGLTVRELRLSEHRILGPAPARAASDGR